MPELSIGRLRGGYCVYWRTDGKRSRHKLEARTRAEAEAEAIDVWRREHPTRDDCTIAELLELYRDYLGDRPAGITLGYTMLPLKAHFGALRPDQVSRSHCTAYQETRHGLSAGTIHTELGHLRSALKHAEKSGIIDRAPHIWRPAKPAPKERFLTRAEVAQLTEAATAPHVRLAIVLLIGTAARVGAILDLEWNRVDFERSTINLRTPGSSTRKGRAVVPMNGMTRAALQAAREAALSHFVIEHGGGPVKSIRKGFASACERAGIEDATIHTLRHTAAVWMAEAGVPMWKISQYLGHSNTAITERVYARYAPSAMQDAADVLNLDAVRDLGV